MHFNLPSISPRNFSNLISTSSSSSSLSSSTINANIRSLVKQGQFSSALQLYSKFTNSTHQTDKFTFPSLLKACASLSNLNLGKAIHASIITTISHPLQFDPYITTSLINMYIKCGSLSDASLVFEKITQRDDNVDVDKVLVQDITLWNSIIDGYFRYGYTDNGFVQFRRMQVFGVKPDAYTLSILLRSFGGSNGNGIGDGNGNGLFEGKQIHGYLLRNMFNGDSYLDTALIDMYLKCGQFTEAFEVFDKLEDKSNAVTWNAIMNGFHRNGLWEKSLEFFVNMKRESCKLEPSTFSTILTACADGNDVVLSREVHCDLIKFGFENDPYVSTSLLMMYSKYRLVDDAKAVFDQITDKKGRIEIWNAMISAYISNGYVHEALDVYNEMRLSGSSKSDSYTLSNILSGCYNLVLLHDFGRKVHGELIKRPVIMSNSAVQSSLLTMYAKCGTIQEANLVFNSIKEKDAVTWSSMISGFCQNRKFEEALSLYKEMKVEGVVKSDSTVMVSVIGACAGLHEVELGSEIHGLVMKNGMASDVFVCSALINMYAKFGLPEMAGIVFSAMPERNLVAWNSIMSCYNKNNLPEMSFDLFPKIIQHGLNPNTVSITNLVVAISSMAALQKGKAVHGYIVRLQMIQSDLQLVNAVIDMYIKCGCLTYAKIIFEYMPERNIITWNSMIAGYGSHGDCLKALELFDKMKISGVCPDEITFLALISSCSHSGLVEEGLGLFQSMKQDYRIEPGMEHYVNMVSLFGRAGRLNEAYRFIQEMPIRPDKSVWLCLLFGCGTHTNVQLGEVAVRELLKLEPTRGSNYIQLLNLYGEGELWEKAANLRMRMKERGLKKNPGRSWIEIKDRIDVFFSGDSSSPRTLEIYDTLWSLRRNMEVEEEDGCNEVITFCL